jgi:cytochrome b
MQRETVGPEKLPDTAEVRAWDLPTRLFHWTLVLLIVLAWVSRKWGDEGLVWHKWNGYGILILIVWRILWGVVGSSTARFSSFVSWPWTAARYGIDFVMRRPRHFLGHNPLGGSVVVVMLGMIGTIGFLGLFAYDDHSSLTGGPLSGKVADETWAAATKWHIWLFDLLLWIIGLHIAASIAYLVWQRENLVSAMISGRKRRVAYEDQSEARIVATPRAILCLLVAIVIVLGGISAAGGRVF